MIRNGTTLKLSVVVVQHVCDPVHTQPISATRRMYEHISRLDLADSADINSRLKIDVLIGSNEYWRL